MKEMIINLLGSKRSFINIFSANTVVIIGNLLSVFLTPFILHRMGVKQYGIWVVLSSLVSYFSLSKFGFATQMLRDLSGKAKEAENKVINSVFFLILLIQLLLLPLLIFLSFWLKAFIKPGAAEYFSMSVISFYLLYAAFFFNFIGEAFANVFYSVSRHYFVNALSIIKTILNFVLIVLAAVYFPVNIVILSFITLALSISCTAALYYKSKEILPFKLHYKYFDKQYIKASLKPSLQYFIISIGALIIFQSDSLVISSFLGVTCVTSYALAYKIVEMPQRLLWNISDVMFPKVSNFYSSQKWSDLSLLIKKIFILIIPLEIILTIILYFFGADLLKIWVGRDYVINKGVLNIFIITFFSQTIAHTYGVIINAIGKQHMMSYMVILEAAINLVVSIILVQRIGIIGVALGTMIAHFCATGWFSIYYTHKNLKIA